MDISRSASGIDFGKNSRTLALLGKMVVKGGKRKIIGHAVTRGGTAVIGLELSPGKAKILLLIMKGLASYSTRDSCVASARKLPNYTKLKDSEIADGCQEHG